MTLADKSIDVADKSFKAISDADRQAYDDYDAEIYDGAHVSIQLIGRRFQEEKTFTLAEYIAEALGLEDLGSFTWKRVLYLETAPIDSEK